VRAAGGLAGYAHGAGANFAGDLALENVDFVEVNDLNAMEPLYWAWNCGSRIVASADEDAFPNFYRSYIIGSNRGYVNTGKRLDYDEWIADFRAGHAFVSSGPLLFFTLEGKGPGEDIGLAPSHHQLHAAVEVESITPIETVELLCNNRVIDAGKLSDQPLRYRFETTVTGDRGGCYAVRVRSAYARHPIRRPSLRGHYAGVGERQRAAGSAQARRGILYRMHGQHPEPGVGALSLE
jgi:hypothetical protein